MASDKGKLCGLNTAKMDVFDVLVVGSGPGGAVMATLLAENGLKVLVVEEGDSLSQSVCAPFSRREMVLKYRHRGMTVAAGRPPLSYVEGCCVGGGSEINSGLYHRTPPEILHQWSLDHGVREITPEQMEPHFAAIEQDIGVTLHPGTPGSNSLRLAAGAAELGWQAVEVPRWYTYTPYDGGFREERNCMSRTFIPRFINAGGVLKHNCRVEAICRRGELWEARGVETGASGGRMERTFAARHLVLAAGAIGTAFLLRKNRLSSLAGRQLACHPTIKVTARFPEPVNVGNAIGVHQVKEFSPRFSMGCAVSSAPHLAISLLDHPEALPLVESQPERMAIYYAAVRGKGRVASLPFLRDPLPFWQAGKESWHDLSDGLRQLSRLLFAAGADTLWPSVAGLGSLHGTSDLSRLPDSLPRRDTRLMTIHLMGSCPMGEISGYSVTDSFGRVHGQKNLHVCDGSLLCAAPAVNPQGSIMAMARRNAFHLLEQW